MSRVGLREAGKIEASFGREVGLPGEVPFGACPLTLPTGLSRRDDVELLPRGAAEAEARTTSSARSDWEEVEWRRLALLTAGDSSRPT